MQNSEMGPKYKNLPGVAVQITVLATFFFLQSCSDKKSSGPGEDSVKVDSLEGVELPTGQGMIIAPGLEDREAIKPLCTVC